ncbi:unnamed protein product [Rotaria sordida]|uniref:Uncharacterized protein n=1 Tax=Rotaria sordida TaxID=392033 RepID=A0A814HKM7_9BILA|nr:unnamed protein product [Rotaria sordida]CAF3934528.1 unnamed protein product [Rotaria sordida]
MAYKSERQLVEAVEQCQLNKIIYLVEHGYNIYVQNTLGQNFLIHILQQQQRQEQSSLLSKKCFQLFQFLIKNYNLNIHSFDYHHKNVFNWATNLNCTQEALYLLNSNPGDIDILARDKSGSCSLHYAVEHGNEILVHTIVNYLVRYRLRFDIKDAHNNTPEDIAKKLGYTEISNFLEQACRLTVFMSREIPDQKLRPQTNKSKRTTNTITTNTITSFSSSTSSSSSLLLDSSENFNLIEKKINEAKRLDDWKTVAILRSSKKNSNNILQSIPEINKNTSSIPKLPLINNTKQSIGLAEQMLHLFEVQISPSYRRSFIPIYRRSINMNTGCQRPGYGSRKMSHASSRRRSSVLSLRKRDSEISQISISTIQEIQNRFSLPAIYKSHRQSLVTTN